MSSELLLSKAVVETSIRITQQSVNVLAVSRNKMFYQIYPIMDFKARFIVCRTVMTKRRNKQIRAISPLCESVTGCGCVTLFQEVSH